MSRISALGRLSVKTAGRIIESHRRSARVMCDRRQSDVTPALPFPVAANRELCVCVCVWFVGVSVCVCVVGVSGVCVGVCVWLIGVSVCVCVVGVSGVCVCVCVCVCVKKIS